MSCFFPAISSTGTLSPEATRRLTLIAKVLQNVSNGVLFSAKEEFMVPLNPFLEYNFKLVRDFIDDFVVRPIIFENAICSVLIQCPVSNMSPSVFDMLCLGSRRMHRRPFFKRVREKKCV